MLCILALCSFIVYSSVVFPAEYSAFIQVSQAGLVESQNHRMPWAGRDPRDPHGWIVTGQGRMVLN